MRRLVLLAFIWGWSFLFIKVIVDHSTPQFVAWGRITLGFAVVLAFLHRGGERLPERRWWGHLAVLALAMSVMPFTLIAWGEERVTSALASVLNATTPLFAAAFSAWLLRARLRPPQLAGLAVALAGVAVVAGLGGGDLAGSSLTGTLAVVAGSAGYGFGFTYAHRFVEGLSPIRLAAGQLATAALLLTPGTAADLAAGRVHLTPLVVLCLLLLGALGTGYAYVLNYRILKDVGGTGASLVTYLIPIVGVGAGVLVLHEPFSLRQVAGALVIVVGIALVQGRLLGPRPTLEPAAGALPDGHRGAPRSGPPRR
ncbi:MAG TPA: DMT family transporter [Actinomycetota bacterium]